MTGQATSDDGSPGAVPALLSPGFVGRQREFVALRQMLAAPPAVVLIEGEAGIGKSRLLAEYLRTVPDQRVLVADCPPFRQPQTLGPVVDALRKATGGVAGLALSPLAGALRPIFPEWAAALPPAPEPAEDAASARHRLFRALAELLGCLEVAALAVEDAHWADEATLEFLLFLAFRRPQQVSLVLTYRPYEVPDGSLLPRLTSRTPPGAAHLRLTLGMLDAAATAELVSSMLGGERVSEQFTTFVHERTEGVPLAIEETIRLIAARADLTRRGGGWVRRHVADLAVPATIRDAVLERAGRLGEPARAVLRAAAVLADPAGETSLAAVSGLDAGQVREGLSSALQAGLLRANQRGDVSFRHALAAQASYDAIPAPQRRALHLRAGVWMESLSPTPVAQLARHFREAGETARWLRYAERAADLAVAAGDEATAIILAGDLMTGGGPGGRAVASRIMDRLTFASLAELVHHLDDLRRNLQAVLRGEPMEPAEEALWRFHLGGVLVTLDEWEAARAEFERAIPHLAHEPARVARAMSQLAWPYEASSPASVHLRWLRRAKAVVANTALEPRVELWLLLSRTACLLMMGEDEGWAEAARCPYDAPSARERQTITLGHSNNGELAVVWGRYAAAERSLATARKLAQTHNYLRFAGTVEMTQAHLDWFRGNWNGLADRLRGLAENVVTQPEALLDAELVSGLLHAAVGEHAVAEAQLRAVLADRLRRGALAYAMEPAAELARIYLGSHRAAEALLVTSERAAVVELKRFWVFAAELAPAHVAALTATGRTGEATDFIAAFGRGLRRTDAPAAKAALILCWGMLAEARGEYRQAARTLARAAAAWQALPRPYDALLTRERQARCLLAGGETDPGRMLLTQVLAGLAKLGATCAAERVARTLRENGVRVRRPGAGRPGYGSRLSPRELDVVRLIAGGRTNRQIAESLFLSPKTVATHVNAAMRKLNVPTRTALAMEALRSGIVSPDSR